MSIVYVVQNQHRTDAVTGQLIPKFDLTAAEEHGRLVYLLSNSAAPWRAEPILKELEEKLAHWASGDSLLLIGNPCLMAWAAVIATRRSEGRLALLQWSGREQRYRRVIADLRNPASP